MKFKVGDRVRCITDSTTGGRNKLTGIVIGSALPPFDITVKYDNNTIINGKCSYFKTEVVLLTPIGHQLEFAFMKDEKHE